MPQTIPFPGLKLHPALRAELGRMGLVTPTPIQAGAIPPLLEGKDVIGQARTGSGKTLAFALPLAERCDPGLAATQALVLVPTRELAIQVGGVMARLAVALRLRHILLYGGRSLGPDLQALRGKPQIIVGTPGRVLDHLRQGSLSLKQVRFFVLDEADEMLDKGFAPDVERILAFATSPTRQTALFSATMPDWVAKTAARHLRTPALVQVDKDVKTPPEIQHVVYQVDPRLKLAALRALLDHREQGATIVFGRTKHGVRKLAMQLAHMGYPTQALQGNLSQPARERVMAQFRSGQVPILLATNVAARGLDVKDIAQIINFDLPESPLLFAHRAGRTGRMGRQGKAITLLTAADAAKWREIERHLGRKLVPSAWPHGSLAPLAPALPEPSASQPQSQPQRMSRGNDNGQHRPAPATRNGWRRPSRAGWHVRPPPLRQSHSTHR